jgi:1-pyrroline-5-carboxylate dehydrogenase
LIDEKLVLSLVTYSDRREGDTTFLTALIELTEQGLKEYERVIEIVAAFVKMLREKGPQKYLFDELSQVERLSFEFRNQRESAETAVTLAKSLQDYHKDIIQDILEGESVVTEYNEKSIKELIDQMVPDNMLVALVSHSCKDFVNTEEKWYKTMYSYEDFSEGMKKLLYEPKVGPSKNGKRLDLPPANILIPKNVDLLPKLTDPPIFPKKVKTTEASTIWYKRDHKFDVPKGYGYCSIQTNDNGFPMVGDSQVFLSFYFKIFFEDIREFMYMAEMAGITCKMEIMFDKLTLAFHGFNESLPALVDCFLNKLKEFQPEKSEELFDIKLTEVKNNVITTLKKTLYLLALKNYNVGLTYFGPDQYQYLQLLEQYTFDKFVHMAKNWLKNIRLKWFIAGNLLEQNAIDIALAGEKLLVVNKVPEDSIITFKTMTIPDHTEYLVIDKTYNQEEVNSCIISYFQGKPFLDTELKELAKNHVAIDFIKQSTFDYLRTKLQLGYVVSVSNANLNRILGARFLVQSDKMHPEGIYQKINEYLQNAWNTIKNMTDEQFKVHVEAVCVPLRQEYMNLAEESTTYWKEISRNENLFDRKEKIVEALQSLKRDEVISYFYNLFFGNARRYDYEIVSAQHWEENVKTIKENEESARNRGNKRIKVDSFEQMREINSAFPDIYLLNKKNFKDTSFKVEPDNISKEDPVKLNNLIDGVWTEGKTYSSIIDPLNGGKFIQMPDVNKNELKEFAESLSKAPATGLHNPLTNTYRYSLYGEICKRAYELLSKESVTAHFAKLIQRVAPKDCYKACGEVRKVKEFLAQFSGEGVFSLVYSQSHPDKPEDLIKMNCRWPLGAVAVITPSSSPLELPAIQMLSALFMGNKVILKPSSKTSLVIEEFLRLLHHCGMPLEDCDLIHCKGETFENLYTMCDIKMTQFTGSTKVAEKLNACTKERVYMKTNADHWKVFAPDASSMNLNRLAFNCDQNRFIEDFLIVSKNLAGTEFYEKLKGLAGKRNLKEFTVAPVLSATNKDYEAYRDYALSLGGSKILFGGKELEGHSIPSCYGAWEPSAYFVPLKHLNDPQTLSKLKQKPFGPTQIISEYEDIDELLAVLKHVPLRQTITISNDSAFKKRIMERSIQTTGDAWYDQPPTTSELIKITWSKDYE